MAKKRSPKKQATRPDPDPLLPLPLEAPPGNTKIDPLDPPPPQEGGGTPAGGKPKAT